MKFTFAFILFLYFFSALAQDGSSNYRIIKVATKDSIIIDRVPINGSRFIVKSSNGSPIDSSYYSIDFSKALLRFKTPIENDSIIIEYLRFPDFLTKTYKQLDEGIILEDTIKTNNSPFGP